MIMRSLKILKWKLKKRKFCKLNNFFCPYCIHHDFKWEGNIFRGIECKLDKED